MCTILQFPAKPLMDKLERQARLDPRLTSNENDCLQQATILVVKAQEILGREGLRDWLTAIAQQVDEGRVCDG